MAKKSFKSGLGSLIQGSQINFEENGITEDTNEIERLKHRISQLEEELMLWRTGKLDHKTFLASLKESKLKYNPRTNQFEKLK